MIATKFDSALLAKVSKLRQLKQDGRTLSADLRKSKHFNNPDILEKLIHYYGISELGTNFPAEAWNPNKFANTSSFYDQLAARQDDFYKNLSASQMGRRSVGFVGGSAAAHVQRSLQKYGETAPESATTAPQLSHKRKIGPVSTGASDPKRPKR